MGQVGILDLVSLGQARLQLCYQGFSRGLRMGSEYHAGVQDDLGNFSRLALPQVRILDLEYF